MYLTAANVLHYLLERRFAEPEDVVSGEFTVHSLSRRNHNFRVLSGTRQYLVKQVRTWDAEGRASLDREAKLYWEAKTNPCVAAVAALVPDCYAWDPANSILILECLPDYTELYDLPDRFEPGLARLAGRTMGAFHRAMQAVELASLFPPDEASPLFPRDAMDEDLASDEKQGRRELIRAVRRSPEFRRTLDQLRSEWRAEAVMQGDWKLDNCLISPAHDRLRVIDWEFAAWGDPIWDLATLLQSYWNFWVRWPDQYPIEQIQPALRALLDGYAQPDATPKAVAFAGARMLQTAFELLETADQMTPDVVRLMQASLNILTRPEWAAEQLLGKS